MLTDQFARRRSPLEVDLYHYRGKSGLVVTIERVEATGKCICGDMALGAWKPFALYTELARQLGTYHEPVDVMPEIAQRDQESEERYNTIGRLVDRENEGRPLTIAAYEQARELVGGIDSRGIRAVLLCSPRFGAHWGLDNSWLIYFLANGLRGSRCRLVVVSAGEQPPADLPFLTYRLLLSDASESNAQVVADHTWRPALLPGVLRETGERREHPGLLDLAPYCQMVLPDYRQAPEPVVWRDEYAGDENSAFLAYYSVREGEGGRQIAVLEEHAERCFRKGVHDLALRLYEQALGGHPGGFAKAMLALRIQTIRIAMMNFEAAASQEDLKPEQAFGLDGPLAQTKGWGLLMCSRPREAEPYFERARANYSPDSSDRSYLYLLNISALNQARLGNIEEALALERRIEAKLDALPRPDWQMRYINAINQARLFKAKKDYAQANAFYRRAFAINDGIRRETDRVYFNFTLAQLADLRGDHSGALLGWLRTALHWLSLELPEALAPRCINAVLGQGRYQDFYDLERVAQVLYGGLSAAAEKLGLPSNPARDEVSSLGIVSADRIAPGEVDAIVGADGWSVMVSASPAAPSLDGPFHRALHHRVLELIQRLQPSYSLPVRGSLVVDAQNGSEMAATLAEVLDTAVRHDVQEIHFGDVRQRLSDEDRCQLEAHGRVTLGRGVERGVDTGGAIVLRYRRFIAPQRHVGSEAALLRAAVSGRSFADLQRALDVPPGVVRGMLRRLESTGALRWVGPESALDVLQRAPLVTPQTSDED